MASAREMFEAQFHPYPNLDVDCENTEKAFRLECHDTYMRNCHNLFVALLRGEDPRGHQASITIMLSAGFDLKMIQEQIRFHRLQLYTLVQKIELAECDEGNYALVQWLKHAQKAEEWLVYAIHKECLWRAKGHFVPRS